MIQVGGRLSTGIMPSATLWVREEYVRCLWRISLCFQCLTGAGCTTTTYDWGQHVVVLRSHIIDGSIMLFSSINFWKRGKLTCYRNDHLTVWMALQVDLIWASTVLYLKETIGLMELIWGRCNAGPSRLFYSSLYSILSSSESLI